MSLLETTTFDDHELLSAGRRAWSAYCAFSSPLVRWAAICTLHRACPEQLLGYFKNLSRYICAAMSAIGPTRSMRPSAHTLCHEPPPELVRRPRYLFALRLSLLRLRLIVMDAHQAERVGAVRLQGASADDLSAGDALAGYNLWRGPRPPGILRVSEALATHAHRCRKAMYGPCAFSRAIVAGVVAEGN
jgi:hypothetical protein